MEKIAAGRQNRTTGERAVTAAGGFNPSWQRHVSAYALCADLLGPGRVLDLGAGIGHSYDRLAPRETVGLDVDAGALEGQDRVTVVADMRELPFEDGSFESVFSAHSVEHVPDPDRVLDEVARVLEPGGVAVFITPNRLTFARADEIIDPYHFIEFSPQELAALCSPVFESVELLGISGSARYRAFVGREHAKLDKLLRKDPLRLRRFIPRRAKQLLYDRRLHSERLDSDPDAAAIDLSDFTLSEHDVDACNDVVAVCRGPRPR